MGEGLCSLPFNRFTTLRTTANHSIGFEISHPIVIRNMLTKKTFNRVHYLLYFSCGILAGLCNIQQGIAVVFM